MVNMYDLVIQPLTVHTIPGPPVLKKKNIILVCKEIHVVKH